MDQQQRYVLGKSLPYGGSGSLPAPPPLLGPSQPSAGPTFI